MNDGADTPANRERHNALRDFVAGCGADPATLRVASADASFRSYWRVTRAGSDVIVMDSPPAQEPVQPWLDIGARLAAAGLHVPAVFAADPVRGFLLLEDLGTRTYLPELHADSVARLYGEALDALFVLQTLDAAPLQRYDEARLRMELDYLPEWFLQRHLGCRVEAAERELLDRAFRHLLDVVQAQPYCFVHRDFHSRNLMITPTRSPGIIDFQGALRGPLTYDLASLLRDCYIAWPPEDVAAWVDTYRRRLVAAGITDADAQQFRHWFDYTGLQRHIKVLGLFCRLCYRDGKTQYLADLPLVLRYVLEVAGDYAELADFAALLARATADVDLNRRREEPAAV